MSGPVRVTRNLCGLSPVSVRHDAARELLYRWVPINLAIAPDAPPSVVGAVTLVRVAAPSQ